MPDGAPPSSMYDDEYVPPPTHPARVVLAIGVLLVVAAFAMGSFATTAGIAGGSPSVDERVMVPGVIDRTEQAGRAALEDAGFRVEVVPERNVVVPEGMIFSQEPREGLLSEPGDLVKIIVSAGDAFTVVPVLSGTLAEELPLKLVQFGLTMGEIAHQTDAASMPGEIIEQVPAPGAEVPVGTALSVVVSDGPPPTEVPNVVGLQEMEAGKALSDLGFRVRIVTGYSGRAAAGSVISMWPRAGAVLEYGSEIRITVVGSRTTTTRPRPPTTESSPSTTVPSESPTTTTTPPPSTTTPAPPSTAPPSTRPDPGPPTEPTSGGEADPPTKTRPTAAG